MIVCVEGRGRLRQLRKKSCEKCRRVGWRGDEGLQRSMYHVVAHESARV